MALWKSCGKFHPGFSRVRLKKGQLYAGHSTISPERANEIPVLLYDTKLAFMLITFPFIKLLTTLRM